MARDPEAIPTTKAVRATQATTALAPSTVKFFGTLATNLARSPEDAHQLLLRRHEEIADHALEALGQLRGGAMKLGQLASFVDVDFLPAEYREVYQSKLAGLRDAAPPMSFEKVRQVLEREWEEPVESLFAEFERATILVGIAIAVVAATVVVRAWSTRRLRHLQSEGPTPLWSALGERPDGHDEDAAVRNSIKQVAVARQDALATEILRQLEAL